MGILRTAAVLGAGYFLYKKYNSGQVSQAHGWEDSAPAVSAAAGEQHEGESTFGDRIADEEQGAPEAGRH